MSHADSIPEFLLERARAGEDAARGRLLELYRNYLKLVARSLLGPGLRAEVDPSDLVQEVFLKAHRDFAAFAGSTEPELVAWLRRTLVRSLADLAKYHRAQVRDHRRRESLEGLLDRADHAVQDALAASITSPSVRAARREQAVLLADALARLPEDYREVFILRNMEHVPFDEVAARMGRSPGAARKLWTRAMLTLKRMLEETEP